jgi:hypothetical protein
MDLAGKVIAGYRLQERLSMAGAERAVYTAVSVDGAAPAVVKVGPLAADGRRRSLAEEFAVLERLRQARVVPALGHGVWLPDRVQYLILQRGGPSLAALLAGLTGQRLPPGPALFVVHAAALALASLHDLGWVHADVKPSNLLLDPDGSVILSDLEFASPPAPDEDTLVGTPPFLASELWRDGRKALSPAADVWALGVVLYTAVAGEFPFGRDDLPRLAARVLEGQSPAYPPDMPPEVRQVCDRFLAFEPAARPGDGRAAAAVLAEVLPAFPDARAELLALLAPQPLAPVPTTEVRTAIVAPVARPADEYQLEVSSQAAAPPPAAPPHSAPAPAPAARAAPGAAPGTAVGRAAVPDDGRLRRRSAARWFHRMNPQQSFALSVIFSGFPIQVVARRGMSVAVGANEIALDPDYPVVEVEPCFPGCLISPPRARADLGEPTVLVPFWITPLTEGDLPQACVRVYYRDRLVQTLATPSRVVKRTLARVFAWAGVGWPAASSVLEAYDWTLTAQIRQHFPLLVPFFRFLGTVPGVLLLMAGLFGLAGLFYWLARPVEGGDGLPVTVAPAAGQASP